MVNHTNDVRQWLHSLGLGQYADAFEKNGIEWNHLPDLNHGILKETGIAVVRHRMTTSRPHRVYERCDQLERKSRKMNP